ncbi:bax inhibitor 1-like [Hyalella azteca]|uniref:Bax inhibitor 1-like n=1 Tax=Hyalella azteca TaxID=294128 RepID=A0A979FTA7_HYAAZ|nr:bax inhibitor 1-like [Hyalella azteca]
MEAKNRKKGQPEIVQDERDAKYMENEGEEEVAENGGWKSYSFLSEEPVRKHLKNVYATVTITSICAAAGGFAHLYSSIIGAGLLTGIGSLVLMLMLLGTPQSPKNTPLRLAYLAGFGFLSGTNLGPLLQMAIIVEPTIIMEALLGTAIVFACFSLAALYSPRGKYLYLGGTLISILSTLFFLSLVNLFFSSRLLFQANLYIGLAVMCGFVVYDTQLIIEKKRLGNDDFIMHGMELFIDFMAIFKRILVILTDKEAQNKRNRRRN